MRPAVWRVLALQTWFFPPPPRCGVVTRRERSSGLQGWGHPVGWVTLVIVLARGGCGHTRAGMRTLGVWMAPLAAQCLTG